MFKPLIDWYLAQLDAGGYALIVLLMAIESTFLPLPSELVIPPAAILAEQTGRFTHTGIVIASAVGSWIGATIMYWGARWAGRPIVLRYGRYFLIPEAKVHAAERWAERYGSGGVFFSRLLPVIRHLVGIPFGIVKMNFFKYTVFTLLGSGLWTAVLCWVGVHAAKDPALMQGELHRITLWAILGVAALGTLYYLLVHRAMKQRGEE